MDEVNPMAEMGFMLDKQIVIEPQGFLTPCNCVRDVAAHFIPDGGRLYDLIDRYNSIVTYILNRDDIGNKSDSTKLIAPFLKAFGASDYEVRKHYDDRLPVMPGAREVMDYFLNTMPTFLDTKAYEHAAHSLCEKVCCPISIASSSGLDLDGSNMSKQTARNLRLLAADMAKLEISEHAYELDVPTELDPLDAAMVSTLDDVFLKKFQGTEAKDMVDTMATVGPNEKAYAMLDIRKNTQVDLDGSIYIGGEPTDFQVMDLIKEGNGLSMSFNGNGLAVHGSNIAVMSEDCTVAAVIVAKFYDTGIQGVFDLADNWNREYLEKTEFPDRKLLDEMLRRNPDRLPEVYRITRENVDEIAEKSDSYRTELFNRNEERAPAA